MVIVDECEEIAVILDVITVLSAMASHEPSKVSVKLIYRLKGIFLIFLFLHFSFLIQEWTFCSAPKNHYIVSLQAWLV